jgi:hypothetical protein
MRLLFTVLCIIIVTTLPTQVSINTTGNNPSSSAMLDVSSTNKGFLMPRMTTVQRNAIANPEAGLFVFDLDKQTAYMFDGATWRSMMFMSNNQLP